MPELDGKVIDSQHLPETSEFSEQEFHPLVIDLIHRKIRPPFGTAISSATRKFLKVDPAFYPSGVLECDATVTTVAGDVGETTLNSYQIPLNTISRNYTGAGSSGLFFRKAGNTFRITARGIYTTDDATANVAIKLKIGSTTYHTITTTGATVTNTPWNIDWLVIVPTIGSTGTAESQVVANTNNVKKDSASTSTQTIDTTANQTISLTATWASGDAGDTISIRQFVVELIN